MSGISGLGLEVQDPSLVLRFGKLSSEKEYTLKLVKGFGRKGPVEDYTEICRKSHLPRTEKIELRAGWATLAVCQTNMKPHLAPAFLKRCVL